MTAKTSRTRKDSGRNGTLEVPLQNPLGDRQVLSVA